jgi:hypothetical protein
MARPPNVSSVCAEVVLPIGDFDACLEMAVGPVELALGLESRRRVVKPAHGLLLGGDHEVTVPVERAVCVAGLVVFEFIVSPAVVVARFVNPVVSIGGRPGWAIEFIAPCQIPAGRTLRGRGSTGSVHAAVLRAAAASHHAAAPTGAWRTSGG